MVEAEFKKLKEKKFGRDVYQDPEGNKFVYWKEKDILEGISGETKGKILHVTKIPRGVIKMGHIPFTHYPLYMRKLPLERYPFALVGVSLAGLRLLTPIITELESVNPPLAYAVATSPVLVGILAEKLRNVKFREEITKDIHKIEDFIMEEFEKAKGKLEEVI